MYWTSVGQYYRNIRSKPHKIIFIFPFIYFLEEIMAFLLIQGVCWKYYVNGDYILNWCMSRCEAFFEIVRDMVKILLLATVTHILLAFFQMWFLNLSIFNLEEIIKLSKCLHIVPTTWGLRLLCQYPINCIINFIELESIKIPILQMGKWEY